MNKPEATVQAMGGHLLDLFRLLAFDVRNPHSLSKFRNIATLRRRTGARMMVETGTFRGVTSARCARIFERVYTIELDVNLAGQATDYLRRWPNVEVIQGDALATMPTLLDDPQVQDVLVFLDGHFSGGITAKGAHLEPAVLEVEVLAHYHHKIRAIVVDDFRCFGERGMPTKGDLLRSIEMNFRDSDISVHLDQVLVATRR